MLKYRCAALAGNSCDSRIPTRRCGSVVQTFGFLQIFFLFTPLFLDYFLLLVLEKIPGIDEKWKVIRSEAKSAVHRVNLVTMIWAATKTQPTRGECHVLALTCSSCSVIFSIKTTRNLCHLTYFSFRVVNRMSCNRFSCVFVTFVPF